MTAPKDSSSVSQPFIVVTLLQYVCIPSQHTDTHTHTHTHTHTPTLDIMLFPHKKRLSHYWFLSRMVGKKRRGWDWKRRMLSSNVKQPPHTHTSICSVSFPLITPFHLSPATLIIITLVGKIKLVGLNLPSCPRNGTDHQLKGGTGVSRRQKR